MAGTGNDHFKWNKSDWQRQISHVVSCAESRPKKEKKKWHQCKIGIVLGMGTSDWGEGERQA
jgi:hypothetical protein